MLIPRSTSQSPSTSLPSSLPHSSIVILADVLNMSGPPPQRHMLKLKVNTSGIAAPNASGSNHTPSSTTTPKIKLKLGGVQSAKAPPAASPKIKLSKPKKERPSLLVSTKKRDHDSIGGSNGPQNGPATGQIKKLKLTASKKTPATPFVKLKSKGKPPYRPHGVGYDSEASDREEDPAIEEQFVLRMTPGDDCDYLRKAIEEKRWGKQGADVRLKFLQSDGRRAVLNIRGKIYAASLVDMPCIVEGMKSWDKRGWYKAADICQMLLVLGVVKTEPEAMDYPLPARDVDKATFAYNHGLTPPLRWVRQRRFRKRISTHTIEEVESQVEKLFQQDAASVGETRYELIDPHWLNKSVNGRGESAQLDSESGDGDAYGEDDDGEGYFNNGIDNGMTQDYEEEDDDEADLAAQLEAAMEEEDGDVNEAETPMEVNTPILDTQNVTDSEAATPAAGSVSKEDSGDDESDEDEEEVDDNELEQRADMQRQREEIADLENAIKDQIVEMERLQAPILRNKIQRKIQSLKGDLELKKAAIGEGEED